MGDPFWEPCWANLYNISMYHSEQKKFISDVEDTEKEGTQRSKDLMKQFFDLAAENGIYMNTKKSLKLN